MLLNNHFTGFLCAKTYKKSCFLVYFCYIVWKKRLFNRIFANVKNKKVAP